MYRYDKTMFVFKAYKITETGMYICRDILLAQFDFLGRFYSQKSKPTNLSLCLQWLTGLDGAFPSLRRRRGRTEQGKPYTCSAPGCGKTFFHYPSLFRHRKDKHGMTTTQGDTGVCTQGDTGGYTQGDTGGYTQADLGPCEQQTTGDGDNYEVDEPDGNSEQQEDP